MKKSIICIVAWFALALNAVAQDDGISQAQMQKAMQKVEQEKRQQLADASTFAFRFDKFVAQVSACDSLSSDEKVKVDSTYQAYLAEYKVVSVKMSDEDVRKYSKSKAQYQKAMTRLNITRVSDTVVDTAGDIGNTVSRIFRRTKSKVQGAIDGFKKN